jgi:hypothetical protein
MGARRGAISDTSRPIGERAGAIFDTFWPIGTGVYKWKIHTSTGGGGEGGRSPIGSLPSIDVYMHYVLFIS